MCWNSYISYITILSMIYNRLSSISFKSLIIVVSKSLSPAAEFAKVSALVWSSISIHAFSRRGKIVFWFKWFQGRVG